MAKPTKLCPDCSESLNLYARLCACGWREGGAKALPAPDHGRCDYRAGSDQCHAVGTISDGTNGKGRWLCGDHFFSRDPVMSQRIVEMSQRKASSLVAAVAEIRSRYAVPDHSGYPSKEQALRNFRKLAAQIARVGRVLPAPAVVMPANAGDAWEAA